MEEHAAQVPWLNPPARYEPVDVWVQQEQGTDKAGAGSMYLTAGAGETSTASDGSMRSSHRRRQHFHASRWLVVVASGCWRERHDKRWLDAWAGTTDAVSFGSMCSSSMCSTGEDRLTHDDARCMTPCLVGPSHTFLQQWCKAITFVKKR